VRDPEQVKKGLIKQECVIADATGGCKVILWEDNVEPLEKDQSGMMVRVYTGRKYLSIPKITLK